MQRPRMSGNTTNQPTNQQMPEKKKSGIGTISLPCRCLLSSVVVVVGLPGFSHRLVKGRREDIGTSHGVKLANPRLLLQYSSR